MKNLLLCGSVAMIGMSLVAAPRGGVPAGCDSNVMSEAYWKIWNADEQAKIDADIEANRKADAVVVLDAPEGTEVTVEQLDHDFRFGAHIFNFNQLGKTEYNDAYKASYGAGGLFNQATVSFYWNRYEPTPGHLRAGGCYEDSEEFWNALASEAAQKHLYWRRPAAGPVVDFLKQKDVAVHGHILIWGYAKPYWIYDWYCPEEEKRILDAYGIPRHSAITDEKTYRDAWRKAWGAAYAKFGERELAEKIPVFTANMRRLFRKRVQDVAAVFGDVADSWDVVNESSLDWANYGKARTGLPVLKSFYGLMPGDYALDALLDAKELVSPRAKLAINDWNIVKAFLDQVEDLTREGARIDLVGCQMHIFDPNACLNLAGGGTNVNWVGTPQVIESRLDLMAKTGRPIHVSEVTISAPGATARDRQIQAILVRNIYRKWFSHKALMGITWWNTVDGGGAAGEPAISGLFTRDMKRKPAYDALDELINREWKTHEKVKVEGQSQERTVRFRGFRGTYRLTWKGADGKDVSKTVYLK